MNIATDRGETLLTLVLTEWYSASSVKCVELLVAAGANVNLTHCDSQYPSFPPLFIAVYVGDIGSTMALLAVGADVNEEHEGWRPIDGALRHQNVNMMLLQLNSGARVDQRLLEKSPPLWGRDNEGGKASDWSRIQNPAF